MPIAFTLSPFQLACCIAATFSAVALSYMFGREDGRERFRRQLVEQARQDGVQALRFLRRGHS